jgi:hypothetical protein
MLPAGSTNSLDASLTCLLRSAGAAKCLPDILADAPLIQNSIPGSSWARELTPFGPSKVHGTSFWTQHAERALSQPPFAPTSTLPSGGEGHLPGSTVAVRQLRGLCNFVRDDVLPRFAGFLLHSCGAPIFLTSDAESS